MTALFIAKLVLGIVLLAMGRELFWLFLGGIGFILAFGFAERTLHGQPHTVITVIALCAGGIGALAAVFFQRFAVLVAGFLAGGYFFAELMREFGMRAGDYRWLFFVLGGIVGALLMKMLFRWTLIILSSVIGAGLVLQAFPMGQQMNRLLFMVLLVVGIAFQSGLGGRKTAAGR